MDAKKLLKKHLDINIPKHEYKSEKQLIQLRYDASIDAINEAINYTHCCETFFCNNKRSKEGRCVEQCGVCSEYASR